MSEDVYVTRAAHHFDGAQDPISEGDWRAIIESDPDLWSPDTAVPNFARWGGASSLDRPWIDWSRGNLFTRNPDDFFLRKLIELAAALGARVQGGDGSDYRLDDDRVIRVPPPEGYAPAAEVRREKPPRVEVKVLERRGRTETLPERLRTSIVPPPDSGVKPVPPVSPRTPTPVIHDPGGTAQASFAGRRDDALRHVAADRRRAGPPPFKVGQRVRTSWGRPATVLAIDPSADGGVGHIDIKYDDGRTASMSCLSHGLEPM